MPEGWTRNVFSSHVESVSYDPDSQSMTITWKSGKRRTSVYEGVAEDVADEASRAASVGSFLREHVKGKHQHRYGSDDDE
jgi:hypothetical protein